MTAYYNEIDPFAAAWLRELIKADLIAPGIVDERSIEDVKPNELRGFTQCHFFAGIGVWSHALRQAGWPDDKPAWTGSCPCQPFSAAGKGAGFDDQRHLWPSFAWLIQQCAPSVVLGEQVASKATGPWFDLVQADLEGMGYAFGLVPFSASSVGAPHIRDRAYWVADSADQRLHGRWPGKAGDGRDAARVEPERFCDAGRMADASCERRQQNTRSSSSDEATDGRTGRDGGKPHSNNEPSGNEQVHGNGEPNPTNGFWRDADWLGCRDGKFRPVEPGTFPLAHGSANRVGRLRGYGNAINAQAAKVFIESYMGM